MSSRLYILILCVGLLASISLNAESGGTFHVSNDGDDSNPGTLERPFKSIEKARDDVRGIAEKDVEFVIYLRDGLYQIGKTIEFDQRDSGAEKSRITYRAYENEKPVISGGVNIEGWSKYNNGLWKAPAKGLNFRQLYVDGQRAVRARTPNPGNYYTIIDWDLEKRRIIIPENLIGPWPNFNTVEMVTQQYWGESYLRLNSFSSGSFEEQPVAFIAVQKEETDILFPRPYPFKRRNMSFHFENSLMFLDASGEWYLDNQQDMLYYKPFPGQDMSTARFVAPVVETLVNIAGTLDEPVKNLSFEGITFEYSTWLMPGEKGYLNGQAGQYNVAADEDNNQFVARPPAGIMIKNAHLISFENNIIRHMGSTGIDLISGTRDCRVVGNFITDISGNGVSVGKFTQDEDTEFHIPYNPPDKREICTNDLVGNNVIYKTGRDYYGTCGVACGYPAGLRIEHNVIKESPWMGIHVGFGWTDQPNAMRENIIANNDVSAFGTLLGDDTAGIYTLSRQPGTKIIGNYIHDVAMPEHVIRPLIAGVYNDERSGGTMENPMVVAGNLITGIPNLLAHFVHQGTIILTYENKYSERNKGAKSILDNAGLEAAYQNILEKIK